jgi:hypothetical protein
LRKSSDFLLRGDDCATLATIAVGMFVRIVYRNRNGNPWQRSAETYLMACVECGCPIHPISECYYVRRGVGPVCVPDGEAINLLLARKGEELLPLQQA